jgi:hypothetical protein
VSVRSPNPLTIVAGVREELRRAGAGHDEITGFTEEALAPPRDLEHALEVARQWVGCAEAT